MMVTEVPMLPVWACVMGPLLANSYYRLCWSRLSAFSLVRAGHVTDVREQAFLPWPLLTRKCTAPFTSKLGSASGWSTSRHVPAGFAYSVELTEAELATTSWFTRLARHCCVHELDHYGIWAGPLARLVYCRPRYPALVAENETCASELRAVQCWGFHCALLYHFWSYYRLPTTVPKGVIQKAAGCTELYGIGRGIPSIRRRVCC